MDENIFKQKLIVKLKKLFPGCMVLHLNPNEIQGIPDLLVLFKDKWAVLEGKKSLNAPYRPNQPYYISLMNSMSFARMICPENESEVLHDLQQAFRS